MALVGAKRDRAALAANKARLAAAERTVKAMEWECEVLRQRLEEAEGRNTALSAAFEGAVADAAQRGALKVALLERKLSAPAAAGPAGSGRSSASRQGSAAPRTSASGRGSREAAAPSFVVRGAAQRPAGGAVAPGAAHHVGRGPEGEVGTAELPAGLPAEPADGPSPEPTTGSTGTPDSEPGPQQGLGAPAPPLPAVGSPEWALAMLAAALHTPLPEQDASVVEDDEAAEILGQLAEMEGQGAEEEGGEEVGGAAGGAAAVQHGQGVEAAGGEAGGMVLGAEAGAQSGGGEDGGLFGGLHAKLSQAALDASAAAEAAAEGGTISAVHSSSSRLLS